MEYKCGGIDFILHAEKIRHAICVVQLIALSRVAVFEEFLLEKLSSISYVFFWKDKERK